MRSKLLQYKNKNIKFFSKFIHFVHSHFDSNKVCISQLKFVLTQE